MSALVNQFDSVDNYRYGSTNISMAKYKYILFFTTIMNSTPDFPRGQTLFEHCPVSDCIITNNQSALPSVSQFDAVIFHLSDLERLKTEDLPDQKERNPNQRYVMFFLESPQHWQVNVTRFNNFFNWTMTYRMDSDIPYPDGWIVPKLTKQSFVPTERNIGHWDKWENFNFGKFVSSLHLRPRRFIELAQRPPRIAWIVSNCNTDSDRERYVNELKKYIQVDVFGSCGTQLCSPKSSHLTCIDKVEQKYMFYLAFENSFCDQYVTEKLWTWLLMDIVPVVLGQANYAAIMPPHSFINAGNFPEPKDLAYYLKKLSGNKTEYLSYFWWKDFYKVNSNSMYFDKDYDKIKENESKVVMPSYCKLCQMLNDPKEPPKIWSNVDEWMSKTGGHCKPKGSFPWSKFLSSAEDRLLNDLYIILIMTLFILLTFKLRSKRYCRSVKLLIIFAVTVYVLFLYISIPRAFQQLVPWDAHFLFTKCGFLWK